MTVHAASADPTPLFLHQTHEDLARCFAARGLDWPPALAADTWQRALLASDWLIEAARLDPLAFARDVLAAEAPPPPDPGSDASAFAEALRRYRRAMSLRLVLQACAEGDHTEAVLEASSRLAETCIELALQHVEQQQAARYGWPRLADGRVARMAVIGMGKLGGGELNFSSDVDLILAFAEHGETDGTRPISHEEFHARVGQRLAQLLSEVSASGFVLRVDYRLRPFGSAGRVALSFAAMEHYYQREGRDWERYAWTKARVVAGDLTGGAELIASLRPFVYRRYLDFTAIEGLRELKARIDAEVERRDREHDLKLGPGGIREIEFTVQLQQLIRAGREAELRTPRLLDGLAAAARLGHIDAAHAAQLRRDYLFLRRMENHVQMMRDAQTHALPEEPLSRWRIALAAGFADVSSMEDALAACRARVSERFAQTLEAPSRNKALHVADEFDTRPQDALQGWSPAVSDALNSLLGSLAVRRLDSRSRERFERAVPRVLGSLREAAASDATAQRIVRLLHAITGRPAYLALLAEKRGARGRLVDVFERSAFLAERVIAHPLLLDDLLDERALGAVPDAADIRDSVDRALARAAGDTEAELAALHEVRQSLAFRLGLAWLDRRCDAVAVAQRLTALAQSLVDAVRRLAQRDLEQSHGALGDGFLVLGYGSLGGGEIGFGSDLDLVFLFDDQLAERSSDGARPLEAGRWFMRLAQRILHWLGTASTAGNLYDIDTRLRPDGAKGLPVLSLAAFAEYQHRRAWLWEHQALVRARVLSGPVDLAARFAAIRSEVLAKPRETEATRSEVARMRGRWRQELDRSKADVFDLKQGLGGLVDIEFLVQFGVLDASSADTGLTHSANTPELIGRLVDCAWLDAESGAVLLRTHQELLGRGLDCTLDARPRVVPRQAELAAWTQATTAILGRYGLV